MDNRREEEQRSTAAAEPAGLARTLYIAALVQEDGSENVCGPVAGLGVCMPAVTTNRADADQLIQSMQAFANESGCTVRVLAFSGREVLGEVQPQPGAREVAAAEAEIDGEISLDGDEGGGPDDPDRVQPSG